MKRLFLTLLVMVLLGMPAGVRAEDEVKGEAASGADGTTASPAAPDTGGQPTAGEVEEAWEEMAELPPLHYVLEPDIETWLGFRFVHVNGSNRAMEYGWPHSSAAGGFKLHYSPLPHRLDTELDWLNKNDYNAEFSYAYRDIIKLDYIGIGLWHNLDHFVPQPNAALVPTVEKDPNWDYHVAVKDNRVALRLKWPDRAFHVFGEFRQLEKEGTVQQRFYARNLGAGPFLFPVTINSSVKLSRSRDIDWITRQYKAGANGHLGPVEVEYFHRTKTFDPHGLVRPMDIFRYDPGTGTSSPYSVAHGVVPELVTQSDTVRAHTDLTGRVVGSATFVSGEKKNNTSHSEVDFLRGFADLTLIPFKDVTVAFRYRYNDLSVSNPASIFDQAIPASGSRLLSTNKDSMSSRTNKAEVSVRYSPSTKFAVKAEYRFENIRRENALMWSMNKTLLPAERKISFPYQNIPYDQNIHTIRFGVNARPVRTVDFKGSVEYVYTSEQAYPVKPKNSFKGRFDADWSPRPDMTADVYYRFARDKNESVDMRAERDNMGAMLNWMPVDRLSVYANYDYARYNNNRDVDLEAGSRFNIAGVQQTDAFPQERIRNRDASHLYSIGAGYSFFFPLSLDAEYHQSWSAGRYRTKGVIYTPAPGKAAIGVVNTKGLGELTDVNTRETGGSVTAKYDLPKGWGVSVNYCINNYEDMADKPQDGAQDGTAHSMLVMLSKKW